ncbi:MAG: flavin reductase family protein [Clostridiales bacterium]|nr:flavin reductase family protein [Clostridiales bacterium]
MKKIAWKPGTVMAPLPALLVTCGPMERPNAMTAGWTGILCSDPPITYVSIQPIRYSHGLVSERGVFVLNLTTEDLAFAVDFCGVKSGRDMDKLAHLGLTVERGPNTDCPMLVESPVNIECRVRQVQQLGTHDFFMADIVGVHVAEALIDEGGRFAMERAGLITYAHGQYQALGRSLGRFGYTVRKKK